MSPEKQRADFIDKIKADHAKYREISSAGYEDMEGADSLEFLEAETLYVCAGIVADQLWKILTVLQPPIPHPTNRNQPK